MEVGSGDDEPRFGCRNGTFIPKPLRDVISAGLCVRGAAELQACELLWQVDLVERNRTQLWPNFKAETRYQGQIMVTWSRASETRNHP